MGRKAVFCLLYFLAVVFTGLLLAAAVLSWRASFVSPEQGGFWATIALLMPVVLLANLAALVWWLIRRRWVVALMPLAALLLNMGYVSSMIQLPDFNVSDGSHDIRIATLNVNGFRQLGPKSITAAAVAEMMRHEQVDVLCLQEFLDDSRFTADSIGELFSRRMPYFVSEGNGAVASRYPILDCKYVRFPDTSNDYLRADLLVEGDTVRIFSVHLQTSGIAQLRRRFQKDYNREAPVDSMLGAVDRNSRIRAAQVREIRAETDASPYPVILAGDFNDTPSSYTYREMKGALTDGFRRCGNGYGGTFRYLGGLLRIDYIFYDDTFECVRYYMPSETVSDHKVVIAELRFKEISAFAAFPASASVCIGAGCRACGRQVLLRYDDGRGGGTFAPPLFGRGAKNRRGARFGPGFASAVAYRFRARSAPRRVTVGRCRRWCPPRFRTGAAPWRS